MNFASILQILCGTLYQSHTFICIRLIIIDKIFSSLFLFFFLISFYFTLGVIFALRWFCIILEYHWAGR